MNDFVTVMFTWTTYGTWLPGDARGWEKRINGAQMPSEALEEWCRSKMSGEAVLLRPHDRNSVEMACQSHCEFRKWKLLAVNARTNHAHVVAVVDVAPEKARDQLKANSTQWLRRQLQPLIRNRTWTRGGDCDVLETEDAVTAAVRYVVEGQD